MGHARVVLAWVLLIVSILEWPISALTLAKDEPQFVLGLSWMAIAITSLDVLFTASVREQQDKEEDSNGNR
jgi:hypothetical protein